MGTNDDDDLSVSLEDLKLVIKKASKFILGAAAISGILALLWALILPLSYTAKASFREKINNEAAAPKALTSLLLGGGTGNENSVVVIKSYTIMQEVARRLGQQGVITTYSSLPTPLDVIKERMGNIVDNIVVQFAYLKGAETPALPDVLADVYATDIDYAGEVPRHFDIQVQTDGFLTLREPETGLQVDGQWNVPFVVDGAVFTLQSKLEGSLSERYVLKLLPLRTAAEKLRKHVRVDADLNDPSFLALELSYPTRQGVSTVLNTIMEVYRDYLVDEHHRIMANQVNYLKNRQIEMDQQLSTSMEEYALMQSGRDSDFDSLLLLQQKHNEKKIAIDLELKHLDRAAQAGGYFSYDSENPISRQALANVRQYRQQCDAIELALRGHDSDPLIYEGITLETANELFIKYSSQLHDIEADVVQHNFILKQLNEPDFEMSSLDKILNDTVSREISAKASNLSLAMQDQGNRTTREIERLQQDLDGQKLFLANHLKQVVQLLKLRADLFQTKIRAIQSTTLSLLKQQITIEEKDLLGYTLSRISDLQLEQQAISQQQRELQLQMSKMPKEWAMKKVIDMHRKGNQALLQQIGSLVESKNIEDNIDVTLSAPFDMAQPPLQANSPHLLLFLLLGILCGGFAACCWVLGRSIVDGVDASEENLLLARQNVAGDLSSTTTLATLRNLLAFLCGESETEPKTLLLLEGQGPDYAVQLSDLLTKRGNKVLLIPASEGGAGDGLWHYLEKGGALPKIAKTETFDVMDAGQDTPFAAELLASDAFSKMINELSHYHWIVVARKVDPISSEAQVLLTLFKRVAVTLHAVKLMSLRAYFRWSKTPGHKLSFVFWRN